MICFAYIFLNLIKLHVIKQVYRPLLSLKCSLLQCSKQLTKSQGRRVSSHFFPSGYMDFILHGAHFHTLKIFWSPYFFFAICKLTKAISPITQPLNANSI